MSFAAQTHAAIVSIFDCADFPEQQKLALVDENQWAMEKVSFNPRTRDFLPWLILHQ
jgi:hypothetical protein